MLTSEMEGVTDRSTGPEDRLFQNRKHGFTIITVSKIISYIFMYMVHRVLKRKLSYCDMKTINNEQFTGLLILKHFKNA